MSLIYGWKQSSVTSNLNVINSSSGDPFAEDIDIRQKKTFLKTLCRRPTLGLTEVSYRRFIMICQHTDLGAEGWEGQSGSGQSHQEGVPYQNGHHGGVRVYQPHAYLCISVLGRFHYFIIIFHMHRF